MRRKSRKKLLLALVLGAILAGTAAAVSISYAAEPGSNVSVNVEVTQKGAVNWDKGDAADVEASGVGLPPANSGPRGKYLARRAAMVDAQRNLAEYLAGVQLTADTTMEDLAISSDVVRTQTHALVQGARIVSEGELGDGSYQVTLSIPVYGAGNSVAAVAVPQLHPMRQAAPVMVTVPAPVVTTPAPVEVKETPAPAAVTPTVEEVKETPEAAAPVEAAAVPAVKEAEAPTVVETPVVEEPAPQPAVTPAVSETPASTEGYTGIVVDASGLGLSPTFAPVIYNEAGQVIYGIANLDYDFAINHGMVGYASSLADAEGAASRAGTHPLVVKAVAVRGGENSKNPVNVVVSGEDGSAVAKALTEGDILQRAAVVFVR